MAGYSRALSRRANRQGLFAAIAFCFMTALQIFLGNLWPILIVAVMLFPLLAIVKVLSLEQNASWAGRRCFTALAGFSKDEQMRMLHNADRKAFRSWRLAIPSLLHAAALSVSFAAGPALAETGTLPDSLWMRFGVAAFCFSLCDWIIRRLEVHRIRPFLIAEIESQMSAHKV